MAVHMDYFLTEKGLILPIMMPLVWQIIVIIEIERCMFHRMKWIFVSAWYLFGIAIECLLYVCHFDVYVCYIWILGVIAGYPVLYLFSKLGNLINKDLTSEEQKIYFRFTSISVGIAGICIILFVLIGNFSEVVCKHLESKIIIFSKLLYLMLGVSCMISSVVLKKKIRKFFGN